jgi:hypothetical protein
MPKINEVEMREVACLKPFPRNARTHSKEQVEQLAAAIREFGFTAPILISPDGEIRAGHGRLEAARALGMTAVPTLVVGADWSAEKVRAYVIADNKLALNAGWDFEILAEELGELQALDFDIGLTGFSLDEIGALTFGDPETTGDADSDQAPRRLGSLLERFGVAPFSVLNARDGWWQDRKRGWLALGIESEVGRGENLLAMSDTANEFMSPKRARGRRKPNAEPAGGGGGGWKAMNEKMAANRAKLRSKTSED